MARAKNIVLMVGVGVPMLDFFQQIRKLCKQWQPGRKLVFTIAAAGTLHARYQEILCQLRAFCDTELLECSSVGVAPYGWFSITDIRRIVHFAAKITGGEIVAMLSGAAVCPTDELHEMATRTGVPLTVVPHVKRPFIVNAPDSIDVKLTDMWLIDLLEAFGYTPFAIDDQLMYADCVGVRVLTEVAHTRYRANSVSQIASMLRVGGAFEHAMAYAALAGASGDTTSLRSVLCAANPDFNRA